MSSDSQVMVRTARLTDGDELFSLAKELATTSEPSRESFKESFSSLATDPAALVLVAVDEPSDRLVGYFLGFRHDTLFANG